jgi:hypothetical protein
MAKTDYAQTELMRQVPGVGVITSMAFTLTIEDPHRFGKSRDIAGYLGLLPRVPRTGRRCFSPVRLLPRFATEFPWSSACSDIVPLQLIR